MTTPQAWRLFIALAVPEDIKAELAQAQSELRHAVAAGGPGQIRWTRPDQFHLTLKFLGDVDSQCADDLAEVVGAVCRRFPLLRLRARGIGVFPKSGPPRVLWGGVHDPDERLPKFQSALETALKEFSTGGSEGAFTGHVTSGRVKGIRRSEAATLSRLTVTMAGRLFGDWTAEGVDIMRSELSPEGARHARIATIPFSNLA